ncbi:MAG: hypothetical protein JRH13_07445 [Deltaproteobacteria bacterium]|nr:hypothetical protein [Deltaproteobacteria bacterium]MBW2015430.1 hypothetical protein [Deltaproteobacteria bacterium]MBW2129184.1 hypothetical protein [Deltaproteobacteria bacterium]MBW2302798.1 hypothetical protein [Deltaproteobacteria bacterium]
MSFTGTGGPKAVLPVAERIWAVQKKGKTDERRRRKNGREEYEKRGKDGEDQKERHRDTPHKGEESKVEQVEEDVGYGAAKPKKRTSGKVDLVI